MHVGEGFLCLGYDVKSVSNRFSMFTKIALPLSSQVQSSASPTVFREMCIGVP
jgi:hypothetical protein